MAEELMGTEIGLAFIIIGILLFLVEATMPGFLVAVPGTVLIALGILMSFDIVSGIWLLPIGLVVGLGSLYGTVKFYQSFAPPDTPSEMSIQSYVGRAGKVTKAVSPDSISGKVRIEREVMRATSDLEIAVGISVEVVSAEGITLTVKPKE
jgi:membrane-bound ClpP family serine protease